MGVDSEGRCPGCGPPASHAPTPALGSGVGSHPRLGPPRRPRASEHEILSGRGATVAHVLWEHEDVGPNPTAPTNSSLVNRAKCVADWGDSCRDLRRVRRRTPGRASVREVRARLTGSHRSGRAGAGQLVGGLSRSGHPAAVRLRRTGRTRSRAGLRGYGAGPIPARAWRPRRRRRRPGPGRSARPLWPSRPRRARCAPRG